MREPNYHCLNEITLARVRLQSVIEAPERACAEQIARIGGHQARTLILLFPGRDHHHHKVRSRMKTALTAALIGLGLLIATSSAWAQSQSCMAVSATVGCKPEANAALMISGGESPKCQLGNISDVYVVTVSTFVNLEQRTYIRSAQGCAVLPITAAIGTRIKITGVLQDTGAQPGAPGLPDSPVNVR